MTTSIQNWLGNERGCGRASQHLARRWNDRSHYRVQFKDGYLSGSFAGDIGTEDANRTRYTLALSLKLRGNVLNGAMTALSLPSSRLGMALTHWVELEKE